MTDKELDILEQIQDRAERTGVLIDKIIKVGMGIVMSVIGAVAAVLAVIGGV